MTVFGVELGSLRRLSVADWLEHGSAVVAIGTLWVVLRGDAGRDTAVMVWVILACLPALLFTRPWRHVSTWLLYLLASLPVTAIAVSYLTPTGFAYARDLCVWAYACVLTVVALAYARTPGRRTGILVFVCVLGFYDFFQGFVPWKYKGDPAKPMVGTFYQQDMFGAFCVAVALTAAALAVFAPSPWRWIGWAVAPLCAVGCILSTSRAAEGLLAVGALALGALAAFDSNRRSRVAAWGGIIALSVGLLFLLTGPLVFPDYSGSPIAGTTRRAGSDSLGSSSSIRQAYWVAALHEFRDAPVTGEGFGAYGLTFFDRAPLGAFGSRYAHNGFLQGLAEGGVLFGLPLLVAGTAAGLAGLRALAPPRRGVTWESAVRAAGGLGALALLGHTLVDFDWSFPVLAGVLGVLAAASRGVVAGNDRIWANAVPLSGLAVAAVFCAYAVHSGLETNERIANAQQLASSGRASDAVHELTDAEHALLPNPQLWGAVLAFAASDDPAVSAAVSPRLRDEALRQTAGTARLDPHLEFTRARVMVRIGRREEGLSIGRRVLARSGATRPDLIGDYALLLNAAGQRAQAVQLLSQAVRQRASSDFPLPDNVWRLVETLQSLAGTDSDAAACAFSLSRVAFGPASRPGVVAEPRAVPASCSS